MLWLGIDVGGTFTDLVLYDPVKKTITIDKVPSTPHNQAEGILAGMKRMGLPASALERMAHGTTVATNTALERNGAKIAALTTTGHRDVLVVGRGNRMELYNIKARPKEPLLSRSMCFEIDERVNAKGEVILALNEQQVAEVAEQLKKEGVQAVAVCFLHSYNNPTHELRCAELISQALPEAVVVTSAQVLPEYREFERFSTAAINAYVAPRMRRYLGDLEATLKQNGLTAQLQIMTSNGGSLPVSRVYDLPVLTMLSGPAAGVIATAHIGQQANHPNLITCDIGGTSTDVCLVQDGEFGMTTDGHVGTLPIKIRQIDIHTIGMGGGSIARNSAGGFLSVGPRSAGSRPGPACYGRGGIDPTVTDANVVLGRLSVDRLLGNEIKLDLEAAHEAIESLAKSVGLNVYQMAEGVLRLATIALAGAIKDISIMKGYDPRNFALMPYGGAGPLHAIDIAEELGMQTVVIPPLPGTFSALGLLIADSRRDYVKTSISALRDTDIQSVLRLLQELVVQANLEFDQSGFDATRRRFAASLDVRYSGQSFELSVPVDFEQSSMDSIEKNFQAIYLSRFGALSNMTVEIVSYRVVASSLSDKPVMPELHKEGRSLSAALSRRRPVVFHGQSVEVPIYQRDLLPLNIPIAGPTLIEENGSTTVVPADWNAELEYSGCLVIRKIRSQA